MEGGHFAQQNDGVVGRVWNVGERNRKKISPKMMKCDAQTISARKNIPVPSRRNNLRTLNPTALPIKFNLSPMLPITIVSLCLHTTPTKLLHAHLGFIRKLFPCR